MLNVRQFLSLILVSLTLSACSGKKVTVERVTTIPTVPASLYMGVEDAEPIGDCVKGIDVIGDFEDCYRQFTLMIPYIDAQRCHSFRQIREIVWHTTLGNQLIKIPEWCGEFE